MKNFHKWILYNSVTLFVVAYFSYFFGLLEFVQKADVTYVAQLITVLYVLASGYIGYLITQEPSVTGVVKNDLTNRTNYSLRFRSLDFLGTIFMGLGLAGTVAGMMISLHALSNFNPQNIGPIMQEFANVASSAPISTLFGIGATLLLSTQLAFVAGRYNE